MFFLIAFLEEAFIIRNVIILRYIAYIICNHDNNAVINNNYGIIQDLSLRRPTKMRGGRGELPESDHVTTAWLEKFRNGTKWRRNSILV